MNSCPNSPVPASPVPASPVDYDSDCVCLSPAYGPTSPVASPVSASGKACRVRDEAKEESALPDAKRQRSPEPEPAAVIDLTGTVVLTESEKAIMETLRRLSVGYSMSDPKKINHLATRIMQRVLAHHMTPKTEQQQEQALPRDQELRNVYRAMLPRFDGTFSQRQKETCNVCGLTSYVFYTSACSTCEYFVVCAHCINLEKVPLTCNYCAQPSIILGVPVANLRPWKEEKAKANAVAGAKVMAEAEAAKAEAAAKGKEQKLGMATGPLKSDMVRAAVLKRLGKEFADNDKDNLTELDDKIMLCVMRELVPRGECPTDMQLMQAYSRAFPRAERRAERRKALEEAEAESEEERSNDDDGRVCCSCGETSKDAAGYLLRACDRCDKFFVCTSCCNDESIPVTCTFCEEPATLLGVSAEIVMQNLEEIDSDNEFPEHKDEESDEDESDGDEEL